jgi:hypothetical protein
MDPAAGPAALPLALPPCRRSYIRGASGGKPRNVARIRRKSLKLLGLRKMNNLKKIEEK